jgi:hypothetical protein
MGVARVIVMVAVTVLAVVIVVVSAHVRSSRRMGCVGYPIVELIAMACDHRALAMEPQNITARVFRAEAYVATRKAGDALATLDIPTLRGSAVLARAYAATGRRREAIEPLRAIAARATSPEYVPLAKHTPFSATEITPLSG